MKTTKYQIPATHEGLITLKETIAQNKRRAKGFHAITWLVEELDKLKGTEYAVQCVVAHGPFARGSKTFQQIDLLFVLENNVDEELAMEFLVDEILSKIYMEIKILPYLNVLSPERLKLAIRHPTPLMRRILKEGIVFYGKGGSTHFHSSILPSFHSQRM